MENIKLSKCCNAKVYQGHPTSLDGKESSNVYFCEKCDEECEINMPKTIEEQFYDKFTVVEFIINGKIRRSIISKDKRRNARESDLWIINFIKSLIKKEKKELLDTEIFNLYLWLQKERCKLIKPLDLGETQPVQETSMMRCMETIQAYLIDKYNLNIDELKEKKLSK